jgi:hypothetical protein
MNFPPLRRHRAAAVATYYASQGAEHLPQCEADRRFISGEGHWSVSPGAQAMVVAIAQGYANIESKERVRCAQLAVREGGEEFALAAIADDVDASSSPELAAECEAICEAWDRDPPDDDIGERIEALVLKVWK